MSHKAFAFDYDAFRSELIGALRTEDVIPLREFIESHRDQLSD